MEFKEREFIPVLLGGDINTYSVARAFYEQYQVKSQQLILINPKYPLSLQYQTDLFYRKHR